MIEQHLRQFLKKFHDGSPLLLALSGGPDSMALFRLFLQEGVIFSVAHVDHGWRAESHDEAEQLAQLCQSYQLPFYTCRLNLQGSNLEDRCRQARYAFFRTCLQEGMQGVVLGHQADDWIETVLKRIFEGARLTKLAGLRPVTQFEGMTLLRPLLAVRKQELINWLQKRQFWFFEDPTNADPKFLRSRLRHEIYPMLQKSFGKSIDTSLLKLAQASLELEEDVSQRFSCPYTTTEDGGIILDLRTACLPTTFAWKAQVGHFFDQQNVSISSATRDQIVEHLKRGNIRKALHLKNCYVKLERRVLMLYHKTPATEIRLET